MINSPMPSKAYTATAYWNRSKPMNAVSKKFVKYIAISTISSLTLFLIFAAFPQSAIGQDRRADAAESEIELSEEETMKKLNDFFMNMERIYLFPYYAAFHTGWEWKNLDKFSREVLEHFAEKGDPSAQANYGRQLWPGPFNDPCLGLYWYTQAARKGHIGSLYWVTYGNYIGFANETREESVKAAYLWFLQWASIFNAPETSSIYDIAAETFEVSEEKKLEFIELYKTLELAELPSPPKSSCATSHVEKKISE
jgi:hypothetical protein